GIDPTLRMGYLVLPPQLVATYHQRYQYRAEMQFPLGVVLPIEKRLALLQWAGTQHLIIEDDYDSEYRYSAHPLPALQSLATANQVAYLGTFSRGIDPTLFH
ncbi:hypothetical protein WP50_11670, partial [Lactiplantibacillus plantarum]